jgi:thiamine-monophosphate kinase
MTGEFELIRRFFLPLATAPGALRLSDDAALLATGAGQELVFTVDTIVEAVHYLPGDPPDSVAGKLLGVNLSDLAAMGAEPLGYFLALALPQAWSSTERETWLTRFVHGLSAAQSLFEMGLLGGDTVSTPGGCCLTATAVGRVPAGLALRRSGAVVGDLVFVSGSIGDAALGLKILELAITGVDTADAAELVDRYRWPRARVALGKRLRGKVNAAADVSDGLVADLGHICRASGVRAEIDAARVPLSAAARRAVGIDPELLRLALVGGDDYELVFTASELQRRDVERAASEAGVPISCVGKITECATGENVKPVRVVLDGTDLNAELGGYQHFSR